VIGIGSSLEVTGRTAKGSIDNTRETDSNVVRTKFLFVFKRFRQNNLGKTVS
jgi:hypothetical protein